MAIPVAVVVVVLAWLLLGSPSSKLDPIAQAATRSQSTSGYRVRMALTVGSSALGTPVTGTGVGIVDARDHRGSMSLALNIPQLGTGTLLLDEIMDGGTIYMKLPASLGGFAKQWIKIDLSRIASVSGLSSLQSGASAYDPSKLLQYLSSVSNGVVTEGHQRVDGFDTTHYHADLDLSQVLASLPSSEQAAAQRALQGQTIPVDVWVDADRLVRRMQMTTADLSFTGDFSDYGPQPRPAIPAGDQVQDVSGLAKAGI